MLIRIFYFFSLLLLWNLFIGTHNFQTGSSEETNIMLDEYPSASVVYSADNSSEQNIHAFSELNIKSPSVRHSQFAFKRKNSNHKNQESAKITKTNFSADKTSVCKCLQHFVNQSFLKSLRISKMLC